jgi:hypothetical protein
MTINVIDYLKSYTGTHYPEVKDADYNVIASGIYDALSEEDTITDDMLKAVGIYKFWERELTIVVGDKDDFARAKENFKIAELAARKFLHKTGRITTIRLKPKHYRKYISEQKTYGEIDPGIVYDSDVYSLDGTNL